MPISRIVLERPMTAGGGGDFHRPDESQGIPHNQYAGDPVGVNNKEDKLTANQCHKKRCQCPIFRDLWCSGDFNERTNNINVQVQVDGQAEYTVLPKLPDVKTMCAIVNQLAQDQAGVIGSISAPYQIIRWRQ